MVENESALGTVQAQKEKIRQRYKGVNPDELEIIPAKPQDDFYDDTVPRRVAVYARVSTDDPRQTSSYELQKNYYEDQVQRHPNWTLVDIYADEGISGTSLLHRDAFNRMIADCRAGKIDMIVTKSVSRFARNIVDCISLVRDLSQLNPPVGVFFETEHIFTLKDNTEMSLSFIATMAQEESHTKSAIMNASIEMRFSHGIFLTPVLLGYDHDEDGNLVINEGEAKIVRLIFFMYLYGYTCKEIAETLEELGCRTKKGNTAWSPSTVLQILRNERHCGAVVSRKTYTPNYLNHKSRKNVGNRTQHIKNNHHDAIVSPEDFLAVQRLISNAKYRNKGILPELRVITEGALSGFVIINPRWKGFTPEDYANASATVADADTENGPQYITADAGEFDFRGFEVVRSQFMDIRGKPAVSVSPDKLLFNGACIRKLGNVQHIEMLIHPGKKLLVLRPRRAKEHNTVQWARALSGNRSAPVQIPGRAFLETMYGILGWNRSYRYRVCGCCKEQGDEAVLVFDMQEPEVYLSEQAHDLQSGEQAGSAFEPIAKGKGNAVVGYPDGWGHSFGNNYYVQAQAVELGLFEESEPWQLGHEGINVAGQQECNYASDPQLSEDISQLMRELKQEGEDGL